MNKTCLILIGHGSKLPYNQETIKTLAEDIRKHSRFDMVETCFMVINKPAIPEAMEKVVKEGATKIIFIPTFLAHGVHTKQEIPEILEIKQKELGLEAQGIEVIYGEPLGSDERIAGMVEEKALRILGQDTSEVTEFMGTSNRTTSTTYEDSMKIIRPIIKEDLEKVPETHVPIIERVVHTTADPEFIKLVVIDERAVEAGVAAIKAGAKIITDVKMVKAGISEARIKRFGSRILTYVDDERVIKLAKQESITRSTAAMRLAVKDGIDNSIIAIGNAPTAAFELARNVREGLAKPALIIATPVGYVGAAASKEEITKLPIPFVAIRGPKGGSALAVAVFNALLGMAEKDKKN
jgi:precorrin-8X/cobalt-precorrin-8 methylmutase